MKALIAMMQLKFLISKQLRKCKMLCKNLIKLTQNHLLLKIAQ